MEIIGIKLEYIVIGAFVLYIVYKQLGYRKVKNQIGEFMKNGAIIVDVRNPDEFSDCCNPKSINMPLPVLEARMHELKKDQKIIVCCKSGGRSEMAKNFLLSQGFQDVTNAGPWQNTVE